MIQRSLPFSQIVRLNFQKRMCGNEISPGAIELLELEYTDASVTISCHQPPDQDATHHATMLNFTSQYCYLPDDFRMSDRTMR